MNGFVALPALSTEPCRTDRPAPAAVPHWTGQCGTSRESSPGRARLGGLLVACWTAVGCSGESTPAAPAFLVEEVDGVRIATTALGPEAEIPVFATIGEPDVTIGVVDGDERYAFGAISNLAGLDGGGGVVADVQSADIRVFDAEGGIVAVLGRRGEGPGEFRLPFVASSEPDAVWGWDPPGQRLMRFTMDGEVTDLLTLASPRSVVGEVQRAPGGGWVASGRLRTIDLDRPESEREGLIRDSVVIRRVDSDLSPGTTLAVAPSVEYVQEIMETGGDRRLVGSARPFAPEGYWTPEEGGGVTTLWGERIELQQWSAEGVLAGIIRVDEAARPVEASDIDRLRSERLAQVADRPQFRSVVERSLAPELFPDFLPAAAGLRRDSEGRYWVRRFTVLPEDASRWLVFGTTGELLGRVELPGQFALHAVEEDHLWGVWADELEVP